MENINTEINAACRDMQGGWDRIGTEITRISRIVSDMASRVQTHERGALEQAQEAMDALMVAVVPQLESLTGFSRNAVVNLEAVISAIKQLHNVTRSEGGRL